MNKWSCLRGKVSFVVKCQLNSINGDTDKCQVYDFDLEGAPDPTKPSDFKKLGYCGAHIVLIRKSSS